jgi:hypothetical protein
MVISSPLVLMTLLVSCLGDSLIVLKFDDKDLMIEENLPNYRPSLSSREVDDAHLSSSLPIIEMTVEGKERDGWV